jgi:hypothetical protein
MKRLRHLKGWAGGTDHAGVDPLRVYRVHQTTRELHLIVDGIPSEEPGVLDDDYAELVQFPGSFAPVGTKAPPPAPKPKPAPAAPPEPVRAREGDKTFKGDDPSTPADEAWEGGKDPSDEAAGVGGVEEEPEAIKAKSAPASPPKRKRKSRVKAKKPPKPPKK